METTQAISSPEDGVSRSTRKEPPIHFTMKIQSFSLLSKISMEKYESDHFEAGGYKWKLALYPSGNKNKNAKDHLSLYLVMAETNTLHPGWEVSAVFRLFLLDQVQDKYLMLQETKATVSGWRFHEMKTEWGFDQFITLKEFHEASNGYLVEDVCVFGAEVFVCKERSTGNGECLSVIRDAITYKHTWKIDNFSIIDKECAESKEFNAADHKWKVELYPQGKDDGMVNSLSLYLALVNSKLLPLGGKIYVEFTLRLVNQIYERHQFSRDLVPVVMTESKT
ncbi:PREDICTED: ubiquitin carboxyl-terminal hydrolase 12-like [Nelumbo nucifera]|uniref:Ubiquitin carboxyl-terminal hydrolase 12-like n=1 Tax=Nelumbo nucifera TaxID=4432 RepID=A0A1U7Z6Z6_NELNU|nr:PREDICTED: ubiquitin carboxyl-terminal hydrolase 12-like [Nelumbo nucifera]